MYPRRTCLFYSIFFYLINLLVSKPFSLCSHSSIRECVCLLVRSLICHIRDEFFPRCILYLESVHLNRFSYFDVDVSASFPPPPYLHAPPPAPLRSLTRRAQVPHRGCRCGCTSSTISQSDCELGMCEEHGS